MTATEVVDLVKEIPNHDDDGTQNPGERKRQATGLLVVGAPSAPVLYVTSSDPRVGAGGGATDTDLDTNSGVLSRLTWTGTAWDKIDLVRGLPRSEENHATNGLQFDPSGTVLYLAQGGNANAGAPSNNFAFASEVALSAAILSVDIDAIDALPTLTDAEGVAYKYDLPTLDDPDRPNANGIDDPSSPGYDGVEAGDPWGGNDGLNQAIISPGGPVQVYSPGWRNPYDLVVTKTPGRDGRLYTIDNAANGGWGGHPAGEANFPTDPDGDPVGACTNEYLVGEPGSTGPGPGGDPKVNNRDNLHLVTGPGYYGGHPNPVRGNPTGAGFYTYDTAGTWRTDPADLPANWPPVPSANPIECDYRNPGETDGALYVWTNSTNGLTEYTATNFGGAMQGDLLTVSFDGNLYRIVLNPAGDAVTNVTTFASSFGDVPLDVTAVGDDGPFPGTVWAATYIGDNITVFEPADYDGGGTGVCTGADDTTLDEDGDGYDNADEIAGNTDPCSAASKPADFDGDLTSDLTDPDDDNDGEPDTQDPFARDPENGLTTALPIEYPLFNDTPGFGFFGLGFTGLMSNGTSDYLNLYDPSIIIAGGAAGLLTIDGITPGDASGGANTQEFAFQFGVDVDAATAPFITKVRLLGPFFDGVTPMGGQSQGAFVGAGTQDDYLRIALAANGGDGGIEVTLENAGTASTATYSDTEVGALFIPDDVLAATSLDLFFSVDPAAGTVQPRYAMNGGLPIDLGGPLALSGGLLGAVQNGTTALAIGVAATSAGGLPFTATWDFIEATYDGGTSTGTGSWSTMASANDPTARHESAFVQAGDKWYLLGGRSNRKTQVYDPATATWTNGTSPPLELHHYQAVEHDGLIYAAGAYTGSFPTEDLVDHIYLYNPVTNLWHQGPEIPAARRRGSSAAVVYQDRIYIAAGSIGGHGNNGTRFGWFDAYDPATDTWTTLPDVPHPRDHVQGAVVDGKLYLVGGRDGGVGAPVTEVDVYDFAAGEWSTLSPSKDLPTPRSAAAVAVLGDELLVIGGESDAQTLAHSETEAFDVTTQAWRPLAPLVVGRHGTQAIVSNGGVYIVAGSGETGGSPELSSQEAFYFDGPTTPGGVPISASALFNSPESVDFGVVPVGTTVQQAITVSNTSGNQAILVSDLLLSGSSAFSLDPSQPVPLILPPGTSTSVSVLFTPSSEEGAIGQMLITHTGSNASLTVSLFGGGGTAAGGAPLYRVNAGGKPVADADLDWGRDTKRDPSPYANATDGGNTERDTSGPIANATGAPDALFTHYRWDPSDAPELAWSFPVAPGTYELRLYFAELDPSLSAPGARVFDVTAEGAVVLDGYDVFAAAGARTAVVETATVSVTDGSLDVGLVHVVQHPALSAIEVRDVGGDQQVNLAVSPATLDFGPHAVSTPSPPSVLTLSNTGDAPLDVTGVTLVGTDAGAFAHSFTSTITLQPSEAATVEVTFAPPDAGQKATQLIVNHTGANSPNSVDLSGEGVTAAASSLTASSASVAFGYVIVGDRPTQTLTLTNTGGTTDVALSGLAFSGSAAFSLETAPPVPRTLTPGESVLVEIAFEPDAVGVETGQLSVDHDGSNGSFTVDLSGQGTADLSPLYRVNAGGKPVADADLDWGRDTKRDPSPYANATDGGNTERDTSGPIANATGAPDALFTHYRWDPSDAPELAWSFPVAPGTYELRLYFAELDPSLSAPGARVFDVTAEGAVVLDGYDVFAAAGARTAVVETATVSVTDGSLDVGLVHVAQHPFLSAIEILAASGEAAQTAASARATEALVSAEAALPTKWRLAPSRPNPFRSATAIDYDVPETATVRLTLYNVLGQEIRTLADGVHEPGSYSVRWDGRLGNGVLASSGVYVYRLQAGAHVFSENLMLVR